MAQSALVTPVTGAQIVIGAATFVSARPNNAGHTNVTLLSGNATTVVEVNETPAQIDTLLNA